MPILCSTVWQLDHWHISSMGLHYHRSGLGLLVRKQQTWWNFLQSLSCSQSVRGTSHLHRLNIDMQVRILWYLLVLYILAWLIVILLYCYLDALCYSIHTSVMFVKCCIWPSQSNHIISYLLTMKMFVLAVFNVKVGASTWVLHHYTCTQIY